MTNSVMEHSSTCPDNVSAGYTPRSGIAESCMVPDCSLSGYIRSPERKPRTVLKAKGILIYLYQDKNDNTWFTGRL